MNRRAAILSLFIVAAFAIIVLRLFDIQILDDSYKRAARNNVLRQEVQHPPRGEVYDRNGELLVRSIPSYDLMAIPRDVQAFDTVALARITGVTPEKIATELRRAARYSMRRPSLIIKQISLEAKLLFDEGNFPGFYTVYRTMRSYPRKIAGNLLGYISEVDEATIQRDDYYQRGDYRGMSGIELTYEEVLRGEKGLKVNVVDVHGITQGSYQDGEADLQPIPGTAITTSLDADLQALGEELMRDKVGSIIAIEPATGEILVMVSSPGYDPDELVGRDRGNNYIKLLRNPRHPLFNRGVMSRYPPGSTFKLVNGLIALQEGVITPSQRYPCHGGYTIGRGVKCHNHPSPVSLQQAVQMSCNTYFCYALRNILDNNRYASTKDAFDVWNDYVYSFGFGRSLGSDLAGELSGFVPTRATYDRIYHGRWNSLTVISLSIGQGELGCTPLQMANLAAILANRGYYYTPHIVRHIDGRDSLDARFYEKHYTKVDPSHFGIVVEGMYDAVHKAGGTGRLAYVPGLDICGKTGTAQNPHGKDHATFLCFAPKDDPKIAVSVYVEHGGFGGSVAAPIASLIVEQYLTDTITRPALMDYIKQTRIAYPYYDRQQQR
ncbi:MAG TPA: penicillin-binding protein 2 [Candidatus Tidjanibacter faecipullorum]|uniref:Penicillin-binding protein 2 n=1 Tax=Candidatus Tidjanibacter faecipullorum TaxID=2838766 RepID=A0A9D2DEN3_9BACT|nr:penicillin-binding protein 2 [Candidatus Tidjanibacter faecipullorum]